jgi:tyrosyl-tRNA synthetase
MKYDFLKVKEAILFNTQEVLPGDQNQLDQELEFLVNEANKSGEEIKHYIGFEISGKIHLGTGFCTALKIKKLQEAGIRCQIFLANYHTWLNEKLDGKKETISEIQKVYFQPVFEEVCKLVDCDSTKLDFINGEDLYKHTNDRGMTYLDFMMKVAKNLTLSRVSKSITVTGKKEGEAVSFGILCYPVMQVADAFFMQSHIVHAGMDQRKCHVLMREVAKDMDEEFELKINNQKIKPIVVHHNLLLSFGINSSDVEKRMSTENEDELKMSKSKPNSAIWVHDSVEEITSKINQAYCPMPNKDMDILQNMEVQKFNPILVLCKYLIFPADLILEVSRPEKFGGDKKYHNYQELENDYLESRLHPMDFKNSVAMCLIDWLRPVRDYIDNNPSGLQRLVEIQSK